MDEDTEHNAGFCFLCDKRFIINPDGTTNHTDDDGNVDHDEDADHVPYQIGR